MLDDITKRKINSLRQILVGKVPDPKSQVDQITNALIYKYMDDMDRQAEAFGGKAAFFVGEYEKYSWRKLMDPKLGGQERMNLYVEALEKMGENKNLSPVFRQILRGAFIPYRSPETLNLFLTEINSFAYEHSEELGNAYEYLLSIMGSQGDAGQFRTPRHIIDFIVDVVDPQKGDTILDPACGTAGFLISAYKHILGEHDGKDNTTGKPTSKEKHLTPAEMRGIHKNFVGYDISPEMGKLSRVNMFLHSFPEPKIHEYDTLSSDDRWDEKFDVILANPPFMSPKGGIIPHKKFSIPATRAEVLFVDYIMEHLRPHGRAGIIVPEGIIFQSGSSYKQLRKKLVDDGLFAVASLPSGVFNPYSGVKTSVLLFDMEMGKQRKEILFVKIENDGFDLGAQRRPIDKNDLPEAVEILKSWRKGKKKESAIAHWVKREMISETGDHNLSGDRFASSSRRAEVTGAWPMVKLGEVVVDMKDGGTPSRSKPEYFGGDINWAVVKDIKPEIYDTKEKLSEIGLKNSSAKIWPVESIIISLGATIGNVGIAKVPIATKQGLSGIIVDKEKILPKYLYYVLVDQKEFIQSQATGASIREVRPFRLKEVFIFPLPTLEVQKQIVAELDGYQNIISGAKQIVENWKPNIDIDPKWQKKKISEIATLEYGIGEAAKNSGELRYVRITDIDDNGELKNTDRRFIDRTNESEKYLLQKGDVLVARTGATYGKTLYFDQDEKSAFAGFLIRLNFDKDKILSKYFWCFAQTDNYWEQAKLLMTGGGQPQFNANAVSKMIISLPPLKIQKQIVEKIEAERALVESSKKLIEIYEQKMKEVIAKLWN